MSGRQRRGSVRKSGDINSKHYYKYMYWSSNKNLIRQSLMCYIKESLYNVLLLRYLSVTVSIGGSSSSCRGGPRM